ncbi:hypothetical protein LIER_29353 [Lithospermum erythrorhizon]|uniref:Calcineurin B-like protein n=1 Tax=Lithospermum erythrorhizon TaxID=34254 RepID=A0AAV3RIV3_LITER
MGCYCSKSPPQPAADEVPNVLAAQTHFTVKDVKALHELFRKLSCSITDDHFISREKFQLGLFNNSKKQSLFSDRMFDLFDSDHDGLIEFGEFVRSLSIFHPEAPQAEKAMCMY